jgi:hypothetical protein
VWLFFKEKPRRGEPEQDLNRAEIGTGFEQVRREAVPQGMGMDVLVLQARAGIAILKRPRSICTCPAST